ncbi:MAG: hypothetical protein WDO74_04710 [Pseudomonadota bacterium]
MNDRKKALVSERLKMVHRLIEWNETLADPSLMEQVGELGWTHFYGGHDALVNYLLLTCFDVLGSQDEWFPFGEWLVRSANETERNELAAAVPAGATPVSAAKHMHDGYNRIYGVRQSFFRFIDNLDDVARTELLASIEGRKSDALVDDKKKKDFLYGLRNAFTHEAIAHGQMTRVIVNLIVLLHETGGFKHGLRQLVTIKDVRYMVRRWPLVLYETVARHIGEPIPLFNIAFTVDATIDGQTYKVPGRSLADLDDPEGFRSYARAFIARG